MKVIYSQHALDRMAERKLSTFAIEASILKGGETKYYDSLGDRLTVKLTDTKSLVIGLNRKCPGVVHVHTVFVKDYTEKRSSIKARRYF